jgi:hypothetical protein
MLDSSGPKEPSQAGFVSLRIKSEGFELPAPLSGRIAQSFAPDAARQSTFDRRPDEVRYEKCERDRHVDLTRAAFLTCCDLLNVGHRARYDLVEPATTSGNCADPARTALDPRWDVPKLKHSLNSESANMLRKNNQPAVILAVPLDSSAQQENQFAPSGGFSQFLVVWFSTD